MKAKIPFLQNKIHGHALGRSVPEYALTAGFGGGSDEEYSVSFPFKRSARAILISGAFLVVFCIPLFSMADMFTVADDSLFSLISLLFSLFWVLGWSIGIAVLLLTFLSLSFGKESLHVTQDKLTIRFGISGIGLSATYDAALIRNFRYQDRDLAQGKKWRGNHMTFDYGDMSIGFGSNIDAIEASRVISRLNRLFPHHDAAPVNIALGSPDTKGRDESSVEESVAAAMLSNTSSSSSLSRSPSAVRWNSSSVIALILANLLPLFGVWFLSWDIGQIMLLFWAESAIIGYYNLCKMRRVGRWLILFYGPFFVGHYGAFMAAHLFFIYALFGNEIAGDADISSAQVFFDLQTLWPALLGLFISHGISYYTNFVKKRREAGRSITRQMQEPYRRVIIMHVTLIFGGFLTLELETGLGALMLLLFLKVVADLRSHIAQHSF
jgi:Family of unknown function (DUF6498)